MDKLTVDPSMGAKLADLQQSVEICDAAGNTLGWFRPLGDNQYYVPAFTKEELREAEKEEGRPLSEILADLERLK
jgi:hypothetical protein